MEPGYLSHTHTYLYLYLYLYLACYTCSRSSHSFSYCHSDERRNLLTYPPPVRAQRELAVKPAGLFAPVAFLHFLPFSSSEKPHLRWRWIGGQ
ncbi:hypothetical protein [Pontibacter roseus]|uniref:hypothetical protein n=1 Tax=Pontibacter roseus TaxID=336989 RepID=UPI0012FA8BB7|nr:hypothetical protein [Pontibacter roseus]